MYECSMTPEIWGTHLKRREVVMSNVHLLTRSGGLLIALSPRSCEENLDKLFERQEKLDYMRSRNLCLIDDWGCALVKNS